MTPDLTETVDLSTWRGDPNDTTARELLSAISRLSRKPRKGPEPQHPIRIYVSYRRSDSGEITDRIHDRLSQHFGHNAVHMDLLSLQSGQDWSTAIEQQIRSSDVMLAVIGPHWLTETDTEGRRRLDDPGAFVRRELSVALRSQVRVVPVLIGETPPPRPEVLPEDLQQLAYRQAVGIRSDTFDQAMDRLTAFLDQLSPAQAPPPESAAHVGSAADAEIERLLEEIKSPETPPERRVEIGDRLAELGDPRPGIGLTPDGLPDIDWVDVPAGEFLSGEEGKQEHVDAFRFARYPVTNAQYQAFIDAGGYKEDRWWAGLAERVKEPHKPNWPHPNRPRTDVTWYEAVASCRWLSSRMDLETRLPTDIEWERSARGTDGREHPWGNGYRAGFANVDETVSKAGPSNLTQTTAAGLYPHAASPFGVLDLAGNVLEWCLNNEEEQKQKDSTARRANRCTADPGSATTASRVPLSAIITTRTSGASTSAFGCCVHCVKSSDLSSTGTCSALSNELPECDLHRRRHRRSGPRGCQP